MGNIKGKGIRVEIAKTFGAPINLTEISNANPGVVSAAAHGQLANTCGYLTELSGMASLEGQAVRIKNPATGTFELQGVNTTTLGDFNTGKFVPVTAWETLAEATGHSTGGGAGEKLDATRLIDTQKQEEQGNPASQTVSIPVLAQSVPSAAAQIIEDALVTGALVLVRVTLQDGSVRVYRGEPSQPGEDIQRGQLATGSLDITVKGRVLKLAA